MKFRRLIDVKPEGPRCRSVLHLCPSASQCWACKSETNNGFLNLQAPGDFIFLSLWINWLPSSSSWHVSKGLVYSHGRNMLNKAKGPLSHFNSVKKKKRTLLSVGSCDRVKLVFRQRCSTRLPCHSRKGIVAGNGQRLSGIWGRSRGLHPNGGVSSVEGAEAGAPA